MKRSLLLKFWSHSVQEMLIYRQTAVITGILGFIFFALEIIAGQIYFDYTDQLLGWSRTDYLLLVATASVITFLYQFLFVVAHENLSEAIVEGELDYAFMRPVDSLFYYVFYRLDLPSAINLLLALAVQVYYLSQYQLDWWVALAFVGLVILAVVLVFILNQLAVSVSFWKERASSIQGIPEYLTEVASRPFMIYPNPVRFLFIWLLPIVISFNLPVLLVRREAIGLYTIWLLLIDLAGLCLVRLVWKKGLEKYVSSN